MLNEKKIKIMTKLALYEKNKGKQDIGMMKYYKDDYVSIKTLKTNISITFFLVLVYLVGFSINAISTYKILSKDEFIFCLFVCSALWILMLIISTIRCKKSYQKKYVEASIRIKEYEELINQLDNIG